MAVRRCPVCGHSQGSNPACAVCRQHKPSDHLEDLALAWMEGRNPSPTAQPLSKDWLAPAEEEPGILAAGRRNVQPSSPDAGRAVRTPAAPLRGRTKDSSQLRPQRGSTREPSEAALKDDRSARLIQPTAEPSQSSSRPGGRGSARPVWLYALIIGFLLGLGAGFRWATKQYDRHLYRLQTLITTQRKWLELETKRRLALELKLASTSSHEH